MRSRTRRNPRHHWAAGRRVAWTGHKPLWATNRGSVTSERSERATPGSFFDSLAELRAGSLAVTLEPRAGQPLDAVYLKCDEPALIYECWSGAPFGVAARELAVISVDEVDAVRVSWTFGRASAPFDEARLAAGGNPEQSAPSASKDSSELVHRVHGVRHTLALEVRLVGARPRKERPRARSARGVPAPAP